MLELHAIAAKKAEGVGEFAVAMTAEERRRFLRGIRADYREYYKMLGTVNAETSECSRGADRDSIHEAIRGSVGFGRLSRMVFGVLEEWMQGQLEAEASSCVEAEREEEAMEWTTTLALVLSDQGRHDDALAMRERVLEFSRRVLPENHPDIGEGDVWYGICMIWIVTRGFLFDVQVRPWAILPRRTLRLEGTRMRLRWGKGCWSSCVGFCRRTILQLVREMCGMGFA